MAEALKVCYKVSMNAVQHEYTVQLHKGRPVLHDNGQPRATVMYCPGDAFGNIAREDVERFLAAGTDDFYLWVGRDEKERDMFTTPFWHEVNELGEPLFLSAERFNSLSEKVAYIIQRNPAARFLFRYYAHPPRSWKKAYPEEMAVDETGAPLDETSLASVRYEADHRRALLHMVRWIERQEWAWRVMGYLSLHEFEGTGLNAIRGMIFDYSAPMQRAFRESYPQWEGVPQNRFAQERLEGRGAHWPDPGTTAIERDYLELVSRLFLRRCQVFVETVREAVGARRVLIGMDALKQGMQGWVCEAFFSGVAPRAHHSHILAASGSVGADEVFRIPGFNILNTPYDYIFRHMGGAPEPEGIVDSSVLRGQLFLVEDDCRSFTCSEGEGFGYFRDPAEAAAGLWRNAAAAIARGYQSYWMDVTGFPSPRGGYFRDPAIMDVIRAVGATVRRSLEWEHAEVPGIAVVIDDRAALQEDVSADFQNLAVIWQRLTGLGQTGVPYRIYLWEDLLAGNFPDHRLFIFPNLFRMDQERFDILQKRVCRDGRVVLWGPGTGITDGQRLGAEWASRVTGMPMTLLNETYSRRVSLTRFDHPITARLHGSVSFGDSAAYGPILLPQSGLGGVEQGTVLTTRGVNRPGFAIKEMGNWTSVFTAAVPVPADLIREMARHAGAHVYTEENDVVFASKNFLAVHSVRGGSRTIKLPQPSPVWDAVTGQRISEWADRIELNITPPQTRLFLLTNG